MVEKSLVQKFKNIFGFDRVTFAAPNQEQPELETLFVAIDDTVSNIPAGKEHHRVSGRAFFIAKQADFPIGYLHKKIAKGSHADTKDLFFTEIEESTPYFQDLARRSFSFVYFFSSEYDPEQGIINEININIVEE